MAERGRMRYREFQKWVENNACDIFSEIEYEISVKRILLGMKKTNLFNKNRIWKERFEKYAILLVKCFEKRLKGEEL